MHEKVDMDPGLNNNYQARTELRIGDGIEPTSLSMLLTVNPKFKVTSFCRNLQRSSVPRNFNIIGRWSVMRGKILLNASSFMGMFKVIKHKLFKKIYILIPFTIFQNYKFHYEIYVKNFTPKSWESPWFCWTWALSL